MNRKEYFLWLIYAGLGVQITTSHKAIDAMSIALYIPSDSLPMDLPKLAIMAKELIDWRFNGKRRPRWIKTIPELLSLKEE